MHIMQGTAAGQGNSVTQFRAPGLYGFFQHPTDGTKDSVADFDHAIRLMQEAHASTLPTAQVGGATYRLNSTGALSSLPHGGHVSVIGRVSFLSDDLRATAAREGDASALAQAYALHGEELTKVIDGHFSYIVVDLHGGQVHAGIDRLGIFPLYFAPLENGVVWGTDARTVLAHPAVPCDLRAQGIYNYVYFHMVPAPSAIYQGMYRLQNAHRLAYDKDKAASTRRYWLPDFSPARRLSRPGQAEHRALQQHLEAAVARCLDQSSGTTGAFLSGGLDSSSVVGMLAARQAPGTTQAFAIGFDAPGYDEMAYARITARHFNVKLNEYYVTPEDVVAALPEIAASYDEPFGNSSALPAYFCARFARENGMDTLLAGDGGDELFAGNERYAKQLLFERYLAQPGALRSPVEAAVDLLPANSRLGGKARSFLTQAHTPLPARLHTYNFLNQFQATDLFTPEWLESISTQAPEALQNEVYRAPGGSALDRMLYLDWQFTLADNDLRKVSHMCALGGVNVHFPMLDEALVEFSCRIRDTDKLKGRRLRHFYKQALEGWLPDETIRKRKQGFGLPFGVWLREHPPLAELANDALSKLRRRGIFRNDFLDRTLTLHREGHAAYYGELIWILTMLELWLQRHVE